MSKGRVFLRIAKWAGIVLAVLLLLAVVFVALFQDKIGQLVLNNFKDSLKTELKVEEMELSLIGSFPNASVNLKNVEIKDNTGDDSNLLKAETLSFRFGLFSLITGNYKLKSVVIENAELFVLKERNGKMNYDIFKETEGDETASSEESTDMNLSIKAASVNNMKVIYIDELADQEIALRIDDANLSGDFESERFAIKSDASMFSGYVEMDGEKYFVGKEISYNAGIDIDSKNGKYTFDKVSLTIEDNIFNLDGFIENKGDYLDMDLIADGVNCRLGSLLNLVPDAFRDYLAGFDTRSDIDFHADIEGKYSSTQQPRVDVEMGFANGKVTHPDLYSTLKNVTFKAVFSNGKERTNRSAFFDIQDFKARLDGKPIGLKFKMTDLDNPKIDFSFNGELSLAGAYGMFGKQFNNGGGNINIKGINLKGRLNDMLSTNRIDRVDMSGKIAFDKAYLKTKKEYISLSNGLLSFQDNTLDIERLKIEGAGSDITINGAFSNFIPVFFADSINSKNARLGFDAQLNSENVDFERILSIFSIEDEIAYVTEAEADVIQNEQSKKREFIANFLDGTFVANVKSFSYGRLKGKNFRGALDFENRIMRIKGLRADAMDGNFEINGKVYFKEAPYMETYIDCNSIDIEKFFYECYNFGQEVITSENLKGDLNSLILVKAYWDDKGNFRDDKLYALADATITNGELVDFEMMYQFSKYVKLKDLERIKFTETRNQFEIKNKEFLMPAMFIRSNAMNILISGKHSFEHDMDYKMKVNAGQIIWNKFKKFNPKYKAQKAKKKGLFNMYFRIYGNLYGEWDYKMGKKNVKKALQAEESRDFVKIENKIKAEFENTESIEEPDDLADDSE